MALTLLEMAANVRQKKTELDATCAEMRHANGDWAGHAIAAEDDVPSCSLVEALEKQSLFVNRSVAVWGLNMLWELFRHGKLDYHGVFVNLKSGRASSLPVDEQAWARFGYPAKKSRKRKKQA